jgi:photosystem II stability/assembly factor-like uncharacterized protein
MPPHLLLATHHGLVVCARDRDGDWQAVRRGLEDVRPTCVIAREGVVLAGSRQGVHRSDDAGRTWRPASNGLTQRYVRWLDFHPDISDFELAGTEPAGLFISHDGGETWRGRPEVEALRDQHHWFLPYSPEAGCVRGFTFHGQRLYAAVEVGGVLRSDDGGATWRLADGSDGSPDLEGPPEPYVYPDIHSLHVHPSSPDLVIAPTGGGLYRSTDGGATWELLYDCYVRAGWIDPADPRHLLLSPADGVERDGRIEETHDGGATWTLASGGLDVPWPNRLVERFYPLGDQMLAVLSDGQLLAATLNEWQWRQIVPAIPEINALAVLDVDGG